MCVCVYVCVWFTHTSLIRSDSLRQLFPRTVFVVPTFAFLFIQSAFVRLQMLELCGQPTQAREMMRSVLQIRLANHDASHPAVREAEGEIRRLNVVCVHDMVCRSSPVHCIQAIVCLSSRVHWIQARVCLSSPVHCILLSVSRRVYTEYRPWSVLPSRKP